MRPSALLRPLSSALFLALSTLAFAQGKLTPPGEPEPTMHSLEEIWYQIGEVDTKAAALQTDTLKLQSATAALQTSTQNIQTSTADLQSRTAALQTQTASLQTQLAETQTMLRQLVSASGSLPPAKMEVVDSTGDVGRYASLAYGPDGNPAIAYYDTTNADLKFARYNGTTWQITVVDSAGDVGRYLSLAFGPDGQPAIAYTAAVAPGGLTYAAYNGSAWVRTTIPGGFAISTSLKFDPATNQPTIAYISDSKVCLARYNGTAWQAGAVTVIWGSYTSTCDGETPSLAFRPDGQPAIAYHSRSSTNGDLTILLQFDGAAWQAIYPPSGNDEYPSPSLAFDPSGNPAITSTEWGAYCVRYDGSAWQTTTLGPIGAYGTTSLAFAGDKPVIAFFNQNIGDLVLCRYNGTVWQQQTVDSLGTVGEYPSLAVRLSDNQIAIAYYDATNGDLKFVRY